MFRPTLAVAAIAVAMSLTACASNDHRRASVDRDGTYATPRYDTTRDRTMRTDSDRWGRYDNTGAPLDRYPDDEIGFYQDNYFGD